jgi:hypothetical protein
MVACQPVRTKGPANGNDAVAAGNSYSKSSIHEIEFMIHAFIADTSSRNNMATEATTQPNELVYKGVPHASSCPNNKKVDLACSNAVDQWSKHKY